jgi:hypothetical protein
VCGSAPAPVPVVRATATDDTLTVLWSPAGGDEQWSIECDPACGGPYTVDAASSPSVVISPVVPTTLYRVKVTSIGKWGRSSATETIAWRVAGSGQSIQTELHVLTGETIRLNASRAIQHQYESIVVDAGGLLLFDDDVIESNSSLALVMNTTTLDGEWRERKCVCGRVGGLLIALLSCLLSSLVSSRFAFAR